MKPFDYVSPTKLTHAVEILSRDRQARLLAGGTDLLVQMRSGRKETSLLIDVKRIPELNEIRYDAGTGLVLGAAVPCYRISESPLVRQHYPSLADVAGLIGGTQIQGRASIGGNLCNAAPSADAVPLLIALCTTCEIVSPRGTRRVAVEDFCTAPSRTILEPDELLVSLQLPVPAPHSGAHYLRFIPRNEMDIAVVGAGVSVELENGAIRAARVALASVAPTPLFVRDAGDALAGRVASDEAIQTAAELARAAARPITDMRAPADYRSHLCAVLTRRALSAAIRAAQGAA
jgi:carbon-monoxide dehydrogenase medium subunit